MNNIYLDHNATTNIHPKVLDAMHDIAEYGPINPSSIHTSGQKGKALLEESRKLLSSLLGFSEKRRDYQIIFTSSGTEANNFVISNFLDYDIFISSTEHVSIYEYSKRFGNVHLIKVNRNGILDLDDLTLKLKNSQSATKLVSVMLANNETGIIQPIDRICQIAHEHDALMHSDCVQAIGKINVDISELDLDFITISGHKFGGPIGAGALITKAQHHLRPMIIGGGQEKSLRAGTENVMAIVGLGIASQLAKEEMLNRALKMNKLKSKLERGITSKKAKIVGANVQRLPNTSLIINQGKKSELQIISLDLKGISVSAGAACSSGKLMESHVLSAMGYNKQEMDSAIRVSLGFNTTEQEIDEFIKIYNEING